MSLILPYLESNFMTKDLNDSLRRRVVEAMQIETYQPGQNIITYGEDGKDYFILSTGNV